MALAIVLAMIMCEDNIYSIPEFYPPAQGIPVLGLPLPLDGKSLGHAAEHVVVAGAIGFPLIGWLLGCRSCWRGERSSVPPPPETRVVHRGRDGAGDRSLCLVVQVWRGGRDSNPRPPT